MGLQSLFSSLFPDDELVDKHHDADIDVDQLNQFVKFFVGRDSNSAWIRNAVEESSLDYPGDPERRRV